MAPRIFRPNFPMNRYDELLERDSNKQYKMVSFPGFFEGSYVELTDTEQQQRDSDAATFRAQLAQPQPMNAQERIMLLEQIVLGNRKPSDAIGAYKNRLQISDGWGLDPKP